MDIHIEWQKKIQVNCDEVKLSWRDNYNQFPDLSYLCNL